MVCAGLLMASGTAVAAAEPDEPGRVVGQSQSSGVKPGPQHPHRSAQHRFQLRSDGPTTKAEMVLRRVIADATSVFGSGRVPGEESPADGETPVVGPIKDNVDPSALDPSALDPSTSDPLTASSSDTIDPATVNDVSPGSTIDPPAADPVTPVADPAPPVADVAPAADPVIADPVPAPVVETAAPVASPVSAVTTWPVRPVTDVISSVQSMLTSVASTLAPITTNLGTLLGLNQWSPVVNEARPGNLLPVPGTAIPAFAAASALSPLSDFPRVGTAGLSLKDEAGLASAGTVASIGAPHELTAPVEVPLPQIASIPTSVKQLQQFFGHAVREMLRSPSLSALAALALPGIVGLFVIIGAGIRFGYRQAKAILALPASGLARYAPPQPLRLVRSKPAVAISRPAMRFVPSEVRALRAVGPLENAA
jgi:hypothetical protein